jgi:hypothetical protein
MHRHRHRAAPGIGEQTVIDLQRTGLAITAIAALGQRTRGAFEVARRQIVEHQATLAQMPRGQFLLDRILAGQQPVHGRVKIVLVGIGHAEVFSQGRAVPTTGGGQLRGRIDDARGHHGQYQLALATGLGADQHRHAQALQGRTHRLHMAVRTRARDLEGLTQRHEGLLPLQCAGNDVDQRLGQMGEIAQGLVLDLAALAITAPEQMGAIDLVFELPCRSDDVCGGPGFLDGRIS